LWVTSVAHVEWRKFHPCVVIMLWFVDSRFSERSATGCKFFKMDVLRNIVFRARDTDFRASVSTLHIVHKWPSIVGIHAGISKPHIVAILVDSLLFLPNFVHFVHLCSK
jgi:hypothetical protein